MPAERLLRPSSFGHRAQQGKLGTFLLGTDHHIPRHLERKPRALGFLAPSWEVPGYQSLPSMRAQPRPSGLAEVEMPQTKCMDMQENITVLPISLSCHRPLPGAHTRLHHPHSLLSGHLLSFTPSCAGSLPPPLPHTSPWAWSLPGVSGTVAQAKGGVDN